MALMKKKDTDGEEAPGRTRKKVLLLCCLAAALLVGGYCALCGVAGSGKIYPNVTVSGVDLGGLQVTGGHGITLRADMALEQENMETLKINEEG